VQPVAQVREVAAHGREQPHALAVLRGGGTLGEVVPNDAPGRDQRQLLIGRRPFRAVLLERLLLLRAFVVDSVFDLLPALAQGPLRVEHRLDQGGYAPVVDPAPHLLHQAVFSEFAVGLAEEHAAHRLARGVG
jgi:hypothetical protein